MSVYCNTLMNFRPTSCIATTVSSQLFRQVWMWADTQLQFCDLSIQSQLLPADDILSSLRKKLLLA